MWARVDSQQWKHDDDEMISAQKLLKEGQESGHLGQYSIIPINLSSEPGFEALGFALSDILFHYGERVRELSLDSTCKLKVY